MIFQELSKLKRTSIMTSIVLIIVGILMIICPDDYIRTMIGTMGSLMLVFAILGILDFFGSNKALIHYVYLTGWMIVGVVGTAVLLFEFDSLYIISWVFGVYLILNGLSNISSALTYVKRAGRKEWWILLLLALLQIACGLIIVINPWWKTEGSLFKVVGIMMLCSSLVGILRLILLWPIKNE